MRHITALVIAIAALISGTTRGDDTPPPTTTTTAPPTTVPPTTTTTPHETITDDAKEIAAAIHTNTPTTTTTLPDGKCSEWYPLAVEVGWPVERLQTLGPIMWAESRCQPDVSATGSYGLTQIQYNAHHDWLNTEFGITQREQLYDPRTNLATALWLAGYAEKAYGCWAQPWYMSGDWC